MRAGCVTRRHAGVRAEPAATPINNDTRVRNSPSELAYLDRFNRLPVAGGGLLHAGAGSVERRIAEGFSLRLFCTRFSAFLHRRRSVVVKYTVWGHFENRIAERQARVTDRNIHNIVLHTSITIPEIFESKYNDNHEVCSLYAPQPLGCH